MITPEASEHLFPPWVIYLVIFTAVVAVTWALPLVYGLSLSVIGLILVVFLFRLGIGGELLRSSGVLFVAGTIVGTCSAYTSDGKNHIHTTSANRSVLRDSIPGVDPLSYIVVEESEIRKGGSIEPAEVPPYRVLNARAVLLDTEVSLTEDMIKSTLLGLLDEYREKAVANALDGASVYLYLSEAHLEDNPLATADWWPRGHSFSTDNDENINDKSSYETTFNILYLPQQADSVIARFPESKRREIFTALVRAEDRADRKAEEKHPTDPDRIPIQDLRQYDFMAVFEKKREEYLRLREVYYAKLREEYALTEEELDKIRMEGQVETWPLPPR